MDDRTRALVRLSAALARQDRAALTRALADAATAAATLEIEEALLQSHLFVGYPAMLQALTAWREMSGEAARPADSAVDDPAAWEQRGAVVCARIYAGQFDRLRENVRRLHPDLERWMVVDGYGRVLGRPGLDLATRELCIIALLCPQDAAPQLYSHLRGALNAGAEPSLIEATVREATEGLPPDRAAAARRTWQAVAERAQQTQRKTPAGTERGTRH